MGGGGFGTEGFSGAPGNTSQKFNPIALDIPTSSSQYEARLKNIVRNPNEVNVFHGITGNVFSKTDDEIQAERNELLGKIKPTPKLPTSADTRTAQAEAARRQKARQGRRASIKTSSAGLTDDPLLTAGKLAG